MGSTSSSTGMTDTQSERIRERLDVPNLERKIRIFDDEEVPAEETRTEDKKKIQKEEGVKR